MTDELNNKKGGMAADISDDSEIAMGKDDIIPDEADFVVEDDSVSSAGKIKELREKLRLAHEAKEKYHADLQRAQADFINLRKRDEEERKELMKYANQGLLEELIPVLDSFNMAMRNKEAWNNVSKEWRTGVEYIFNQLKGILAENGVQEIDPLGQKYDPRNEEAIEMLLVEDENDDHKIIDVVQKGYKIGDRMIRAPKVKVNEFKRS
ncbi:MAG: nucleotide exchange factor GrpE [Candidatus Taylorbacteria bacterium RIFCSPLOWO2_01_FULL_45_15b]|uniref:Protein GrpE n=1 Tax=Candidatus Taylorbacteria bacterium RIFCSPLOWO2_01_FULL_45_15b TaxID=1802319 RepID=A0A1G2NA96_9BACT|nr:MAG: nucleotide exchange factor GrpE [Candidatus Taylorbacteria bacterium RIFCSPLOWO2_01_FULL_45_15b]